MLYLLFTLTAGADDGTCGAWGAPGDPAEVSVPALDELSGLAASRRYPGVLWAHADSSSGAALHALDRGGEDLGTFEVSGADNEDWEDLAAGPCGGEPACTCLYIADIGDNDLDRARYALYRVPEPDPGVSTTTATAAAVAFRYEGGPRDAEALLVHPLTGEALILVKQDGAADIYAFPDAPPAMDGGELRLSPAGSLDLAALGVDDALTAGDVSPDGLRVALRTDSALLEFAVPEGATLLQALAGAPAVLEAPDSLRGEAAAYTEDGQEIVLGDEGSPALLQSVLCEDFQPAASPDPHPLIDCDVEEEKRGCGGCNGAGGGAGFGAGWLLLAIGAGRRRG